MASQANSCSVYFTNDGGWLASLPCAPLLTDLHLNNATLSLPPKTSAFSFYLIKTATYYVHGMRAMDMTLRHLSSQSPPSYNCKIHLLHFVSISASRATTTTTSVIASNALRKRMLLLSNYVAHVHGNLLHKPHSDFRCREHRYFIRNTFFRFPIS